MSESPLTFLWPQMLWLLLALVPLVGLYLRMQNLRRRLAAQFGSMVPQDSRSGLGIRRHIPGLYFLLALAILIVALARPQMVLSLPRVEQTVILAFDVSGSMAATDMDPTRMEAAKAIAREFVTRQPITVQIGVVAFSESGIAVQPPSNDQEAVLASIKRIEPQRSTSLGSGIQVALDTIARHIGQMPEDSEDFAPELLPTPTPVPAGTFISAVIVLLTDGENNVSPDPLAVAQVAAERGVRIHTVGLGSPGGTTLEVEGFTVRTTLNEVLLRDIAQISAGQYYSAQNEDDLRRIYENINPQLVVRAEKMEVTAIFAGASLLLLLVGGLLSLVWFSRVP